jgi:hypothetical protein
MDFQNGNYMILKDDSLRRKAGVHVLDSEEVRHNKPRCDKNAKSCKCGCTKGGCAKGGASKNAPHHIRKFGTPEAVNMHSEQEGGGYYPYHYFSNNQKW